MSNNSQQWYEKHNSFIVIHSACKISSLYFVHSNERYEKSASKPNSSHNQCSCSHSASAQRFWYFAPPCIHIPRHCLRQACARNSIALPARYYILCEMNIRRKPQTQRKQRGGVLEASAAPLTHLFVQKEACRSNQQVRRQAGGSACCVFGFKAFWWKVSATGPQPARRACPSCCMQLQSW